MFKIFKTHIRIIKSKARDPADTEVSHRNLYRVWVKVRPPGVAQKEAA